MRKGILLAGMFVATLFVMISLPGGVSAQPIKLTYANFPPAPTFPCVQMERWKAEVEKRTGGKVNIQTFPGSTLLDAKNMMDGVIAGQADIGNLCMAYQPGRFIVTNATSLPLDLPDAKVASLVLWDLYEKYKPKEFAQVKVLTMFTCAPSNLMTKKPVRSLEDLKGMPIRASGGAAVILKSWGANMIAMPQSDVPEAFQKGVVQGNFSSLEVLKDFKYAELCRYVTMTNTVIYPFSVVMNMDSWNKLPKDIQEVMDDLRVEQAEWTGKYADDHVIDAIDWSKKNYNLEIIELSKAEKAKWDKSLQPIIDEWIKDADGKGLPAEAIVADIKALRDKYAK